MWAAASTLSEYNCSSCKANSSLRLLWKKKTNPYTGIPSLNNYSNVLCKAMAMVFLMKIYSACDNFNIRSTIRCYWDHLWDVMLDLLRKKEKILISLDLVLDYFTPGSPNSRYCTTSLIYCFSKIGNCFPSYIKIQFNHDLSVILPSGAAAFCFK